MFSDFSSATLQDTLYVRWCLSYGTSPRYLLAKRRPDAVSTAQPVPRNSRFDATPVV